MSLTETQDTSLVIGAGMIGALTLKPCGRKAFKKIFVADVDPSRLKLAEELGADVTIPFSGKELVAEDLAFDQWARGRRSSRGRGPGRDHPGGDWRRSQRRNGYAGGQYYSRGDNSIAGGGFASIRLQGSAASAGEYPRAIELLLRGAILVKPLITAVAPLEDGPRWFERLYAHEPNLMKVVLTP